MASPEDVKSHKQVTAKPDNKDDHDKEAIVAKPDTVKKRLFRREADNGKRRLFRNEEK